MNKMLVVVFDSEQKALNGLNALKDLHRNGDITLYATAVIDKNAAGEVTVNQAADDGPIGSALGLVTGSLVGLLSGPIGVAIGASLGGMTGAIMDLNKAGLDVAFINEVSDAMTPGTVAILADVEEAWAAPVDTRMSAAGGLTFRRLRSEFLVEQLQREAAALAAERREIEAAIDQSNADMKSTLLQNLDAIKKKLAIIQDQAQAKAEQLQETVQAKVSKLMEQVQGAQDESKAKIESQVAHLKADLAERTAKLEQARVLAREALS